jgi:ADP-ribose pyrophosphatase YjhB (NUDIX family)
MLPNEGSHYCYHCGGNLIQNSQAGFSREVCSQCGFIHYQQYKVGVAAIIFNDNKLLLLKRNQEPWKDHWYIPAGYVEIEETPEEAVHREVKEEAGFLVEILKFHTMLSYQDDPRGNGIILFYLCKKIGGEFIANEEISECGFFAVDEIPGKIAGAGHRTMIDELIRNGFVHD